MGNESVDRAVKVIIGERAGAKVLIMGELITRDNVDQLLQKYEAQRNDTR
jgi:hypothetical protein